MIWKRQIPILIVAVVGAITLFGWFIDQPNIKSFVDDDATQWYDILASFAIILGALNLIKIQFQKVAKKKKGWPYSLFAIGGFFFAITAGFFIKGLDNTVVWGAHVTTEGTLSKWIFDYMFTPLSATMFSLLAFFVASASYRAFRIRNFEATLLLVAGIIIMVGRVPIGSMISSWFIMYISVLALGIGVNSWKKDKMITFGVVGIGIVIVNVIVNEKIIIKNKSFINLYNCEIKILFLRYNSNKIIINIGSNENKKVNLIPSPKENNKIK